jgi:signal transduction histidine kinase
LEEKAVSLRRSLSVLTVLLTALALASAISTIQLANYLENTVSVLRDNLESVRVGQQMEIDLLSYSRTIDPVGLSLNETQLQQELQTAQQYITADDERQMLTEAEGQIANLFRLRRSTGTPPAESGVDIESIIADLRNFVKVNLDQAHDIEKRVASVNLLAERLGIAVSVVLVLGVAGVLIWLGWFAFRPLFGIRDAMKSFAEGNPNARAPEVGIQELRRIAQQFNEMSSALVKQRDNQLAFLASVAHDLRNPLGALKMSTTILNPDQPLPNEKRVREILGVIRRQIDHMNRMIGDLLDSYRIESGNLELRLQEVDAREVAREAYELFRYVSNIHELSIELPDFPILLQCDPGRMSQVFNNLLNNAIKYSPAGGPVHLRLESAGSRQVYFEVSDAGIGIPAPDLPYIFEPFRRAKLAARDIPGVGLGLHVVRRIVEAHLGHIEVESRVGEGTTFKISLPRAATQSHPRPITSTVA